MNYIIAIGLPFFATFATSLAVLPTNVGEWVRAFAQAAAAGLAGGAALMTNRAIKAKKADNELSSD